MPSWSVKGLNDVADFYSGLKSVDPELVVGS